MNNYIFIERIMRILWICRNDGLFLHIAYSQQLIFTGLIINILA
jgi:hypothetical protein